MDAFISGLTSTIGTAAGELRASCVGQRWEETDPPLMADLLTSGIPPHRIAYVEMDHPLLHGQSLEALIARSRKQPDGEGFVLGSVLQGWKNQLLVVIGPLVSSSRLSRRGAKAAEHRVRRGRFPIFVAAATFSEYLHPPRNPPPFSKSPPACPLKDSLMAVVLREIGAGTRNCRPPSAPSGCFVNPTSWTKSLRFATLTAQGHWTDSLFPCGLLRRRSFLALPRSGVKGNHHPEIPHGVPFSHGFPCRQDGERYQKGRFKY